MTDESPVESAPITSDLLRGMAAAAGVILTPERAARLVAQAEEHFAQLRHLDAIADPGTEPAAELRLDRRTRSDSA